MFKYIYLLHETKINPSLQKFECVLNEWTIEIWKIRSPSQGTRERDQIKLPVTLNVYPRNFSTKNMTDLRTEIVSKFHSLEPIPVSFSDEYNCGVFG